jgi:thiamine-monophosphate kinase
MRRSANGPSGEDRLIARYFKPIARHPGALGLGDDAAVLRPPRGHELVLTTDVIVGGVHFFFDDPPSAVARKALRVNLSDLAAKGAKPAGFLLSLALPADITPEWLDGFARGLASDARGYSCPLLGGDTVATPGPVTISVAAFGTLPKGTMVRRSGASAGHRLVVTGAIGDAALGLRLRQDRGAAKRWKLDPGMRRYLAARYLLPIPRNVLAGALRRHASAAMDVSDGLAGDLAKLCRISGVGAEVEVARVPLSKAARAALGVESGLIETILTGGDDFEILAAVPAKSVGALNAAARAVGVPLAEIGRVVKEKGTRLLDAEGRVMHFAHVSFSHF